MKNGIPITQFETLQKSRDMLLTSLTPLEARYKSVSEQLADY
jgi:hypothetical protein